MVVRKKTFTITAVLKSWCDVELEAKSLEDALAQAQALKTTDFIDYRGSCNEDALKIVQVYDSDFTVDL